MIHFDDILYVFITYTIANSHPPHRSYFGGFIFVDRNISVMWWVVYIDPNKHFFVTPSHIKHKCQNSNIKATGMYVHIIFISTKTDEQSYFPRVCLQQWSTSEIERGFSEIFICVLYCTGIGTGFREQSL